MFVKGKETVIKFGTYTMTAGSNVENTENTSSDIFKDYDYLFVPTQNNVDEMLKSLGTNDAKDNMGS